MPDTPFLMAALVYVAAGVTMEALTSRRKQHAVFGMGRFWGPQQLFSELAGVEDTTAGYAHKEGAQIVEPIPEVRFGNIVVAHARASHTEVVRVTFDPVDISYEQMLKVFWEHHDPTQSQRQGDDVGPQYRSSIFATTAEQYGAAWASMEVFGRVVAEAGRGAVVTEIDMLGQFEAAPAEQQQYLRTHPDGYNAIAPNGLVYSLPSTPAHQRRAKRTHR